MAKGTSFAEKSKGKKKKSQTLVKYVKSVKSEKTGHWRFNEQMVALNSGENLDGALQRIEQEVLALNMDLPNLEETEVKSADNNQEEVKSETDETLVEATQIQSEEKEEDAESNDTKNETSTAEPVAEENSIAEAATDEQPVEEAVVETETVDATADVNGTEAIENESEHSAASDGAEDLQEKNSEEEKEKKSEE